MKATLLFTILTFYSSLVGAQSKVSVNVSSGYAYINEKNSFNVDLGLEYKTGKILSIGLESLYSKAMTIYGSRVMKYSAFASLNSYEDKTIMVSSSLGLSYFDLNYKDLFGFDLGSRILFKIINSKLYAGTKVLTTINKSLNGFLQTNIQVKYIL